MSENSEPGEGFTIPPGAEVQRFEEPQELAPGYNGETWEMMLAGADVVRGYDLESAKSLIGVPHMIVCATFRAGDFLRMRGAYPDLPGDYVSLECITAPEEFIAVARKKGKIPEDSAVMPNSSVVWNASGTGAYRQVVRYLEARRLIILPHGPEEGEYDESRFDTPIRYARIHNSAFVTHDESGSFKSARFDIRLHCPRGLRVSEYSNKFTKEGETYYLA